MSGDDSSTWDENQTTRGRSVDTIEDGEGVPVGGREDRYSSLGQLGSGAVGVVHRVRDRDLNRVVAMKTLRRDRRARPRALARFMAEAQATAQLQHPGIVPVHDLGVLDDGRLYYTMREVRGRSLREAMREAWVEGPTGTRRVVGWLRQVADAVGYAHQRGVIHRDLKPDNVLIGEHGEVLVVDWGLARVDREATPDESVEVITSDADATRFGTIAGTPAYMAPEQARGWVDRIGPWTDVWAVGAMLYEALCGMPPYVGHTGEEVIQAIRRGPPEPIRDHGAPADLLVILDGALARAVSDRIADGRVLARQLGRWLDGALQRERALAAVQAARAAVATKAALEAEAAQLVVEARELLADVPSWASEDQKVEAWALLDEAEAARRRARMAHEDVERSLRSALTHAPQLPEAHEMLADRAREESEAADRAGDAAGLEMALARLRSHLAHLPASHEARGRHARWVQGTGAFSLETEPAGAQVVLHRFVEENRRLVPKVERVLGPSPLHEMPLEPGSWLLTIQAEGRAEVRYPVWIGRAGRWDGVPPGHSEAMPIRLPTPEEVGNDCYVPPGWYRSGGDPAADSSLPARQLWVDGFIVDRFQVRVRDYLEFLDGLARVGGDPTQWYPRERGSGAASGMPLVAQVSGKHQFLVDDEGELPDVNQPIALIDMGCMAAYAAWRRRVDGLPWRLPTLPEMEKAKRGVDGRIWPWGNHFDASWACIATSHAEGRPKPVDVHRFPVDQSVYGVRGLSGNVLHVTLSLQGPGPEVDGDRVVVPDPEAPVDLSPESPVTLMGGLFHGTQKHARSAGRYGVEPTGRMANIGFRLVRSWPAR